VSEFFFFFLADRDASFLDDFADTSFLPFLSLSNPLSSPLSKPSHDFPFLSPPKRKQSRNRRDADRSVLVSNQTLESSFVPKWAEPARVWSFSQDNWRVDLVVGAPHFLLTTRIEQRGRRRWQEEQRAGDVRAVLHFDLPSDFRFVFEHSQPPHEEDILY